MQIFKKFVLNTCLCSVLILTLFYIFAAISEMTDSVIGIGKYFTILGFGAVISASVLIFDTKLKMLLKYIINYAVSLTAFCVIFLSSASGSTNAVARTFAAIVIFTILYALVFLFKYLFNTLWTKSVKKASGVKNANRKI